MMIEVDGVAGEQISEGHAVYLSDGSGGCTPGRWYRATALLAYASTRAAVVGFAKLGYGGQKTAGESLTVVTGGREDFLGGLKPGTLYYISDDTNGAVPGALMDHPPAQNARAILMSTEQPADYPNSYPDGIVLQALAFNPTPAPAPPSPRPRPLRRPHRRP